MEENPTTYCEPIVWRQKVQLRNENIPQYFFETFQRQWNSICLHEIMASSRDKNILRIIQGPWQDLLKQNQLIC